jgi:hypothetical protein
MLAFSDANRPGNSLAKFSADCSGALRVPAKHKLKFPHVSSRRVPLQCPRDQLRSPICASKKGFAVNRPNTSVLIVMRGDAGPWLLSRTSPEDRLGRRAARQPMPLVAKFKRCRRNQIFQLVPGLTRYWQCPASGGISRVEVPGLLAASFHP